MTSCFLIKSTSKGNYYCFPQENNRSYFFFMRGFKNKMNSCALLASPASHTRAVLTVWGKGQGSRGRRVKEPGALKLILKMVSKLSQMLCLTEKILLNHGSAVKLFTPKQHLKSTISPSTHRITVVRELYNHLKVWDHSKSRGKQKKTRIW